jgi:molybdenum cofactor guanylyltransferase
LNTKEKASDLPCVLAKRRPSEASSFVLARSAQGVVLPAGLILAGGMGRRMDSRDKGLIIFRGKAMVAHVIERLLPQVNSLIINANRTIETYAEFGFPMVSDAVSGFAGPLAGLHAGMRACESEWLVTAPCDSPFLPSDLVARLHDAATKENAEIAVAVTDGFAQPVFAIYKTSLLESLEAFLNSGERKIDAWTAKHRVANVVFDDANAFANINTIAELRALE